MIIDLTKKFLEIQAFKPPILGKYHISGLWGVLNHYDTLQGFLKGKTIDFPTALKMKMGTLKHQLCQECLEGWELEKKIEFKIPNTNITLIGKCDAIKGNTILEIKTSDHLISEAKRWHIWQIKMYLSMFNVENGIILQPIVKNGLFLKSIGEVKKNDTWFKKQLELIHKLHLEAVQFGVLPCQNQTNSNLNVPSIKS